MNAPIRIMISLLNYRASLHLEEKTLWIVVHVIQDVYFPPKLIPAEKMKMALPHLVPLSRQAIGLLEVLIPLTCRTQYIFYNHSTAKHMSSNAILGVIRMMGYKGKMTGHGFRGLALTTLHEQSYCMIQLNFSWHMESAMLFHKHTTMPNSLNTEPRCAGMV